MEWPDCLRVDWFPHRELTCPTCSYWIKVGHACESHPLYQLKFLSGVTCYEIWISSYSSNSQLGLRSVALCYSSFKMHRLWRPFFELKSHWLYFSCSRFWFYFYWRSSLHEPASPCRLNWTLTCQSFSLLQRQTVDASFSITIAVGGTWQVISHFSAAY